MTQIIRQDTEKVCVLNIHVTLNNFQQFQALLGLSPELRPI